LAAVAALFLRLLCMLANFLATTLKQATQALMDATAPGERAVWAHYTDARFVGPSPKTMK
jgi:hypothetical protein